MNPTSTGLLRHSILIMIAAQAANLAHVLFHVVMGWNLSTSEYGLLVFMLNVIMIFTNPFESLRTSLAHFSARLVQEGSPGDIAKLTVRWVRHIVLIGLVVLFAAFAFAEPLARFFNLFSSLVIQVTAVVLVMTLFIPLLAGSLQGLQSFVWMSLTLQTWTFVRFILAAVLVLGLSPSALHGITAQGVGTLVSILLGVIGLWIVLRGKPSTEQSVFGDYGYFARSSLVLAGYVVLCNADILLVNRYLPSFSGEVAQAGTIARTLVWLPIPVTLALFPKVTSAGGLSPASRILVFKALFYVLVLTLSAGAVCMLVPQLPLFILYGIHDPTPEMVQLLRTFIVAMSPLALIYLMANFEMAQHRFTVPSVLILSAVAYIGGVILWHSTVLQVLTVLMSVTYSTLLVLLLALPWRRKG